eukprot:6644877-Prymnesium_polylepis.1
MSAATCVARQQGAPRVVLLTRGLSARSCAFGAESFPLISTNRCRRPVRPAVDSVCPKTLLTPVRLIEDPFFRSFSKTRLRLAASMGSPSAVPVP